MEKLFLNLKNKYQKNKRIIKSALNVSLPIISFGILLYFCASNNNWNNIIENIPKLDLIWILLAILAIMISWYFDSLSILEIIKFIENTDIKKSEVYKITIIGQYFTSITPMGLGAAPAQTSELMRISVQKNSAPTIIGAKFIIYQISLTIYSLLCSIIYLVSFSFKNNILLIYLGIGLGFQMFTVLFVLIFLINKKFFTKLEKLSKKVPIILKYRDFFKKIKYSINFFADALKSILQKKLLAWKLFLYSFVQISLVFSVPFFIFKAFHYSAFPALEIIDTQCVANAVCSFTPLPGNAGASEKIFLDLFGDFFPESEIAVAMIIHRMITFYFSIIVGSIIYFLSKKHTKQTNKQNR